MAHLLVTGGAGYIGSHVLRALLRAGHSALVFDDLRAGRERLVRGAPLVRGDVRDRTALDRVFAEQGPFDGVLHFAALLSVPESVANPLLYYSNNVTGSAVLLAAALAAGTRKDLGAVPHRLEGAKVTFEVGTPGAGRYAVGWK